MKWVSAVSQRPSLAEALEECSESVGSQLGGLRPDLLAVFVSPHHERSGDSVSAAVRDLFPDPLLIGCMGAGVIGAGHEVEQQPAVSLTAAHLPGVTVRGFHVRSSDLPSPDDPPDRWAQVLSVPLDADPHFVLLADPFSMDPEALLAGLDYAFPAAAKIGGMSSGGRRDHALYLNGNVFRNGAVGVALSGNIIVDTVVAQGCRPLGRPMRVTAAEHNMLMEMDGETPLAVLQRLFETLSPKDQELMQHNLFIGIAMDPLVEEVRPGDFLVRNVIGIDPKRGAIAVGALLHEGQLVQFHVRDAEASSQDLRMSLSSYLDTTGQRGHGALLFSCTGRGRYLYGEADHDTGIFRELAGDVPLGGFFCSGEIGRVAGGTYLHSYTSSFGIFRPRAG